MRPPATPIVADARPSESLTELIVTPRVATDALPLASAVRQSGAKLRRDARGIVVGGFDAYKLFESASAIDLRASADTRRFALNRRKMLLSHAVVYAQVQEVVAGGKANALRHLRDARDIRTLDDHQVINVAAMTLPDLAGLCVFDEQGTGKTVTLIYAYDVLVERDEVDFLLIVAPKSMVPEWPRDFARFKGDLYSVAIASGARRDKIAAIASRPDVLVTNFETVANMEEDLRALIRRYNGRAMLAVDESFYVKNLDAQRTRAVRRIREWCDRAYVLCGTPSPNSPSDVIQQFNTVDFGMTFGWIRIPDEPQQAHTAIQRAIEKKGLFVRHLKKDVLPDLPGRRFQKVVLPLQPEQRALYARALNDLIVDVKRTDERAFRRQLSNFLARRIALLQICSNPLGLTSGYAEIPCKLLALDSLLEEIIVRREEKVIVWSFYTKSIDAIVARYQAYNPVRYDGTVADVRERRHGVQRFQDDDESMLFVGNPSAAGAGLTLHRARIAIYESFSNQAAHYLQSLDRIHRRGQKQDVEYLVLLGDGTIESQEYERLLSKQKSSQELLGDPAGDQPTREMFLNEIAKAAELLEWKS